MINAMLISANVSRVACFNVEPVVILSFIKILDDNVYRGCLSESSDHRLLCDLSKENCIKCAKFGCNDVPKIRPSALSCIQCSGSAECAFGFEKDSATKCKGKVQLGLVESCYVYHDNSKLNRH